MSSEYVLRPLPYVRMESRFPSIIQGGMGVGVSGWRLANAVSSRGQLGVVSGTALDAVLVRRLGAGDPGGNVRRALAAFPVPGVAERIVHRYYSRTGREPGDRFRAKPMPSVKPSHRLVELLSASSFVEVFLAKEGHGRPVGINFLEKIQLPTLPALYGAMLAGVDYVLMGAGIPRAIPGILDRLSNGLAVALRLDVKGAGRDHEVFTEFAPSELVGEDLPELRRPTFLAIVSSHILATMLAKNIATPVDGFVVEGPTAGGHNAPPRGKMTLSEEGEPEYGERDVPDMEAIRDLGLPFWIAGSQAEPERLREAQAAGAAGIQVGTAFAFCEESDLSADLKADVLEKSRRGEARIFTDPLASPTGFPFKVVPLAGTLTEEAVAKGRKRICDLGYLRTGYVRDDGDVGWRCPAEPVADYVRKGGDEADTVGRACLCNALMTNIGLGQVQRDGSEEPPLLTAGDDVAGVARFLAPGATSYRAADVIDYLLGATPPACG